VCKDGGLVFTQMMLANFKPLYTHQPGVHVKYVSPDGKITHFSHKFETKNIELTDGNTSIKISGVSAKRDSAKNSYTLTVDEKECPQIKGVLNYNGEGIDPVKFGEDGKVGFNEGKTEFCALFFTIPRAAVTGKLNVNGTEISIDGYGFVSHFCQNMKAHRVALRWQLCKFNSPDLTINQNLLVTPKTYGKARVSNGICAYKGKIFAVTMDNDITYPSSKYDKDTGYDAPTATEYKWSGKTVDGKDFKCQINIEPKRLIDKVDILGHLPWTLRMLLKTFIARPYHYQWCDETVAHVQIGDEKLEIKGIALHEITFINPE